MPVESRDTFWRSLHALNITRIVISAVLLFFWGFNVGRANWLDAGLTYRRFCIVYLLLAIGFALYAVYRRRHFMAQLLVQIVADIAAISVLYLIAGGMRSGLVILYLFPLASAAILVRLVLALFFASLVTIFLLLHSWFYLLRRDDDTAVVQAGLFGAAFLAAVYVVNRLAARLISQETLAEQRGRDLALQQAISQLVIDDMDDGVIVVGSDSTVYASNPSAVRKLGMVIDVESDTGKLSDVPTLKPLTDAFFAWNAKQSWTGEEAATYVMLKPPAELDSPPDPAELSEAGALATHLKARFARVDSDALTGERSVIFLQDVAQIENQAQQLKLASMGRLTASIAHEVRNPLSAIAHASALLSEINNNPLQVRLLNIVSDNAARMNRMVEDILNLSRKAQSQENLELRSFLAEVRAAFGEAHDLPDDMIDLSGSDSRAIRFDPLHLREVLLNLLGNAIRYASGGPGSIRLSIVPATASRLELHIQDDGPGITPEVRAHLFEPFYTTSSKGTGLGLYLARELCLNNGAMLDYEFHPDAASNVPGAITGRFVISFAVQEK